MNEYIVKDALNGLTDARKELKKSHEKLNELQHQLWKETMHLSGIMGVIDMYMEMLQKSMEQ